MAYSDLLSSIASFIQRTDQTANIPTWVAMAEAELNRVLTTRQMVEFATFTVNSERCLLPNGFNGVLSFRLDTPLRKLTYVTPDQMDEMPCQGGCPEFYTILGDSFLFWPAPADDATYTARLRFRTALEPLASVGENWLLDQHPDAYIYGALKHSAMFLIEDERLAGCSSLFSATVDQINESDRKQVQGSQLQTRSSPGYAP